MLLIPSTGNKVARNHGIGSNIPYCRACLAIQYSYGTPRPTHPWAAHPLLRHHRLNPHNKHPATSPSSSLPCTNGLATNPPFQKDHQNLCKDATPTHIFPRPNPATPTSGYLHSEYPQTTPNARASCFCVIYMSLKGMRVISNPAQDGSTVMAVCTGLARRKCER
jgi:hypothetical protein